MFCYSNQMYSSSSYLQAATYPIPKSFTRADSITDTQIYFAYFSVYILFPLLYIITTTGNYNAVMTLLRFIQSGVFNIVSSVNDFLTDIVYGALRIFGQYTFSTYTVVKNGREIYTSSSMYFFYPTDMDSVYRIDRAKYNVCKWIDKQCALYRRQYNGDEPELTETHNDIYDFILHKIDGEPYTRIHRGDFSARTHTLVSYNYRKFLKSYQIAENVELTICAPSTNDDEVFAPETFTINLKSPHHFLLEKNEILDKAFLQWKLYNECGRKDIANYIGIPGTNYKVTMFYNGVNDNISPMYHLNDTQTILIGNRYAIKVDTVLRCPVFESCDNEIYDIDGILSSYYDCSDSESDSDDSDSSGVSDIDFQEEDAADAAEATETETATESIEEPEFEIIGGETPTQ